MDRAKRLDLITKLRALPIEDVALDLKKPKDVVPCYLAPVDLIGEIMQTLSDDM